jgi:hypothetical protein
MRAGRTASSTDLTRLPCAYIDRAVGFVADSCILISQHSADVQAARPSSLQHKCPSSGCPTSLSLVVPCIGQRATRCSRVPASRMEPPTNGCVQAQHGSASSVLGCKRTDSDTNDSPSCQRPNPVPAERLVCPPTRAICGTHDVRT